jgi:hypothetical protein
MALFLLVVQCCHGCGPAGSSHLVDVDSVADVSEVHAPSIFRVDRSRVDGGRRGLMAGPGQ